MPQENTFLTTQRERANGSYRRGKIIENYIHTELYAILSTNLALYVLFSVRYDGRKKYLPIRCRANIFVLSTYRSKAENFQRCRTKQWHPRIRKKLLYILLGENIF